MSGCVCVCMGGGSYQVSVTAPHRFEPLVSGTKDFLMRLSKVYSQHMLGDRIPKSSENV